MNRSFRAQQSQMQASAKQRQHVESMRSSMMKEKEEELALFLDMRKREKERTNLLLQTSEEFDAPSGLKPGTSPIFNITSSTPARKTGTDDFLNSDTDKNDYDWLLTPPTTPLFPSLEMESRRSVMSQIETPKACPTSLKSRLANPQQESSSRCNSASSLGLNSSIEGIRRPSLPGARPATPTGRPTLPSSAKPTLTTAPKSTTTTFSKPTSTSVPKPSRSSTPTARAPPRSTTPLSGASARSSTPTSRPILPASSKPASRAPTPTRRHATPSTMSNASAPPIKSRPSSVTRSCPMKTGRNTVPPQRASSPIVKSRPWKPLEIPGFSLDAPPNLRTSLPDRPHSATRGRPGAPSSRSSSVEPVCNGRVRRQSCSPSRGPPPNGNIHNSGGYDPVSNRLHAKSNDNVSPVLIGANMVDRVTNMRKLVPPKQDDKHSPLNNSSPDSAGFGRTLSKKSLDMAMRHMDIRRHIPCSLLTNIPASSMYSVRSGPTRTRTISVSDSPLATSSNASSEVSVNNNGLCDDDISSDKGRPANAGCR